MPPDAEWHQYFIEYTDSTVAECSAAHHLAPALIRAQDAGTLTAWWYIRKEPGWRLRYQPVHPGARADDLLADLAAAGHISTWTRGIYEPETVAFGGAAAMDVAHLLFHHDSRHLLERAAQDPIPGPGRRETTVLLFSALLRAAGLDWFEQGDVWDKIAKLRPTAAGHQLGPKRTDGLSRAVRRLMTADADSVPGLLPEPWRDAFETAGRQLAALARTGHLGRGLRAVLAHHFIFQANRAGLTGADQATLAALAVKTVFDVAPGRSVSATSTTDTN